jgi:tryptophan-rich sensory protein
MADASRDQGTRFHVLAALLVLCVGGGAAIGLAFAGRTATYGQFNLPSWALPAWLFGPVWTLLYTLMAVSAWLVWRRASPHRRGALTAFGTQLVLNFAWTPAFFGTGRPVLGLAVIVGVLAAAFWWTVEAWRVRRLAGMLQLPYLAWVTFATVLNATIAVPG